MRRNTCSARPAVKKKTLPEDTPIVTRIADGAAEPARPGDSREILEMIDTALEEQADWLRKWHRATVCGLPPAHEIVSRHGSEIGRFGSWFDINRKRGLLDQPVFKQLWESYVEMHRLGRSLAIKAVDGKRLPARDYDTFMDKAQDFVTTGRRIRDAFQRAIFDLDPLTGVHNRRSMMAELSRERERSLRTANTMCVGLCDIDHFKAVNDTHGHLVGDAVLMAVVSRLIANLRPYDSIYRFGGEEFLLAFTETGADQAIGIADRLRQTVARTKVWISDALELSVTASFGLCMVDSAHSLDVTIEHADTALYRAKHEGRNRVALWRPEIDGEAARHD